jgi:hypothetical protein
MRVCGNRAKTRSYRARRSADDEPDDQPDDQPHDRPDDRSPG